MEKTGDPFCSHLELLGHRARMASHRDIDIFGERSPTVVFAHRHINLKYLYSVVQSELSFTYFAIETSFAEYSNHARC